MITKLLRIYKLSCVTWLNFHYLLLLTLHLCTEKTYYINTRSLLTWTHPVTDTDTILHSWKTCQVLHLVLACENVKLNFNWYSYTYKVNLSVFKDRLGNQKFINRQIIVYFHTTLSVVACYLMLQQIMRCNRHYGYTLQCDSPHEQMKFYKSVVSSH